MKEVSVLVGKFETYTNEDMTPIAVLETATTDKIAEVVSRYISVNCVVDECDIADWVDEIVDTLFNNLFGEYYDRESGLKMSLFSVKMI